MTGERNGRLRTYNVSVSGAVAQHIKDEGRRASESGRLAPFTEALRTIYRRLRTDPLALGELVHSLHNPELIIHVGGVPPVTVRFAVHEPQRVVFVMRVFLHPP